VGDLKGPAPLGREEPIDDDTLIRRRARSGERSEEREEERARVVAEDARLAPHRPLAHARALGDHDRAALVAEALRRDEPRDRQAAPGARAVVGHAGKALARAPADDARDLVAHVAERARRDLDPALAAARLERHRVVFEMEHGAVEGGSYRRVVDG